MPDMELQVAKEREALIRWMAEGRTDKEIEDLCEAEFGKVPLKIKESRRLYTDDVLSYIKRNSDELLQNIPVTHQVVRLREIDRLTNMLSGAMEECIGDGKWAAATKLMDTILKAFRLTAEETKDLTKPAEGVNIFFQLIQEAPAEQRQIIADKVEEIKALIGAVPSVPAEAIDADFTVERNSSGTESDRPGAP